MTPHAVAALSPLVTAAVMALVGFRQRTQTGARASRWIAVSLGLGLVASLPVGAWLVLDALGHPLPVAAGVGAWIFSVLMCARMVVPLRLRGRSDVPPVTVTGPVVDQVSRVARRMGVQPPPVRLVGTLGQLQAFAVTVSPLRPSLLIGDGILQRLEPAEVEAILGHELAHVANGSLWFLSTAFASSAALAVLLFGLAQRVAWSSPVLVLFGCWGFLGPLYAAVSRPNERWCDLRAARAIGFKAMSSALDKIHTTLPFSLSGWRSLLVHAVATHPSRAARLASLRRHAPAAEKDALPFADPSLPLHDAVGWAAATVWLACVALSVHLLRQGAVTAGLGVLILPGLLQLAALLAVFLPAQLAARRRLRFRLPGRRLFWGGIGALTAGSFGGVWLPAAIAGIGNSELRRIVGTVATWSAILLAGGGLLAFLGGMVLLARNRGFPGKVVGLLAQGDFQEARRFVAARKSSDPALHYVAAVAAVAAQERELGIAELEALVRGKRAPPAAFLTLSGLLRSTHPERSLELAGEAVRRLPTDAAARLAVAAALRALGRTREADERAAAIERAPGQVGANALALRARLALESGELERARVLLAAASQTAPGEPLVLIVRAEVLATTGPTSEATRARDEARDAVRNNPLLFLEEELSAPPSADASEVGAG